MGLFENSPENEENPLGDLIKTMFPNDEADVKDGTDEVLRILNNSIPRHIPTGIFV